MKWLAMLKALPTWRQGVYWIAVIGMFAVLIWDIADKGAQYTTPLFLVLLVIAVWALRWRNPLMRKIV
jgi:hypothetical protein